ncbi:UDP-2,3-diacylglucosamine diphosphatase [endosymbiont of Lamellibrachia barhami]|uniref:UDP-2,3-diacylglucosamine diphosphatase n=1 Tax=endosymbiont of Lamellibrachia barhami TaxID=205975 RepID=UPI0015A8C315|nr:UDP-2,3-diacylglucosamine diphosphatase [endosymbiont of Lamellibrachia barhami]
MGETLFISDLHLSNDRRSTVQLFLDFLEHRAPGADRLYILGDLFDTWIGDDLEVEPAPQIKAALKRLYNSGSRILLMHGNRDFLLGKQFCAQTGAELIDDPTQIDLFGTATLLNRSPPWSCADGSEGRYTTLWMIRLTIPRPINRITRFIPAPIQSSRSIAASRLASERFYPTGTQHCTSGSAWRWSGSWFRCG